MIRKPVVAGRFYPGDQRDLQHALFEYVPHHTQKIHARAIIVPHAGYAYSGSVAGATYARVELPRRFIILCPNHTGLGAPISIMSRGVWETPLGQIPIDTELAGLLRHETGLIQESPEAHRLEHALEVHLPFLQHFLENDFRFVPISVGTRRLESLLDLGDAMARCLHMIAEDVLMIASSDMNHFEPAERTESKDRMAIEKILSLDARGLWMVVEDQQISMCGCGPAVAVIEASRILGAQSAELVEYSHSGRINGDYSSVVGYAGLLIQ